MVTTERPGAFGRSLEQRGGHDATARVKRKRRHRLPRRPAKRVYCAAARPDHHLELAVSVHVPYRRALGDETGEMSLPQFLAV